MLAENAFYGYLFAAELWGIIDGLRLGGAISAAVFMVKWLLNCCGQ
jgi:hypothetical protein